MLEEIQQEYNNVARDAWYEVKEELDANGFGIGDIVSWRGSEYEIRSQQPKSYYFGPQHGPRKFSISFLGVKKLKATGEFGTHTHRILY